MQQYAGSNRYGDIRKMLESSSAFSAPSGSNGDGKGDGLNREKNSNNATSGQSRSRNDFGSHGDELKDTPPSLCENL